MLNRDRQLNDAEKSIWKEMTKGMTYNEKEYCIRFYPLEIIQNEQKRRTEYTLETMGELFEILEKVSDDLGTIELITILKDCRKLLNQKED